MLARTQLSLEGSGQRMELNGEAVKAEKQGNPRPKAVSITVRRNA